MKIKNLLFIIGLCTTLTGCITDINTNEIDKEINLGTSLVLPIGNVHADMLYLLDIVDSTYVSSDSTNGLCLLYEQQNINLNFNLDTSFRKGEYLIETLTLKTEPCFDELFGLIPSHIEKVPLPSGSYKFSKKTKYDLNFNKNKEDEIIKIDSAVIGQANVDFKVFVQGIELSEDNMLIMSFHYPTLLSEEYEHMFEDIVITRNEFSISETLHEFLARFNQLEDGNLIDLTVDFNLMSTGTTTISRDAKITFETEINLMDAREAYGFVWYRDPLEAGNISYEIPQDIFDNEILTKNNLLFSNPEIDLKLKTNVGVPLRLELNNVYATKGDRIEYASFNGKSTAQKDLIVPKMPFDSAITQVVLNREYGSLHTLLSMLPEHINLDYKVTTPLTEKGENQQFFTLPLLAKLDIQTKLPFQFDPTTSFSYKDTLDADMSALQDSAIFNTIDIDTINVYLDITNSLPVNVEIKLWYLDEQDQIITESNSIIIHSGIVNAEGRVTTPTVENLILSTTGETIVDVLKTKKIIISVAIEGYDENSFIYFQTTDAIDIKVGAFLKANIKQ